MKLSELLVRNKYENVKNLWESWHYYFANNSIHSLNSDIIDDETATIAFLVIQNHINNHYISENILKYVNLSENKSDPQPFIKIRDEVTSKYKMNTKLLFIDPEKNAVSCVNYLDNWKGYRIYGDMEYALSSFLSPYFSYESFKQNLYLVEKKIIEALKKGRLNHIEVLIQKYWAGLFDYIDKESIQHFKNLELIINKNIK